MKSLLAELDKDPKGEVDMKVFEVTAAGFDGSSDETDELVCWI